MTTSNEINRQSTLSQEEIGKTICNLLGKGFMRDDDSALIMYDLSFLEQRLNRLVSAFPPGTLHGLAIKANPLLRIMEWARGLHPGIGVEAASIGEVHLALGAGYQPGRIIYDSPVKTVDEISFALRTGLHLNVDNFQELERIKQLYPALAGTFESRPTIGIRINPQVGVGSILESSVAGEYSKFGVPIRSRRAGLADAFLSCEWLTGLHLHVGSQGCPVSMLVDGIGILYDFMTEINEKRVQKGIQPISIFDIGGGLPVGYLKNSAPPAIEDYVAAIMERAPGLFPAGFRVPASTEDGSSAKPALGESPALPGNQAPPAVRLFTEFGRWSYTNSGWTISRVEYVKHDPGINTVMLHVGADLFVRECLNPKDWPHEFSVYDPAGNLKTGVDEQPYNLAGPLCFSGDIIARNVSLPVIGQGDFVVVHDTGGYTFSMWSRYNSRLTPRILGYTGNGEEIGILRERETVADVARFWK